VVAVAAGVPLVVGGVVVDGAAGVGGGSVAVDVVVGAATVVDRAARGDGLLAWQPVSHPATSMTTTAGTATPGSPRW
jgi:hypothetical protein